MTMTRIVSYDQPHQAELRVHLDSGKSWLATTEDLDKFGLVDRYAAYTLFREVLAQRLLDAGLIEQKKNHVDTQISPLRVLVETVLCHPDRLDDPSMEQTWYDIMELERRLRSGRAGATLFWVMAFHVESRKTSGGLDLEERCLVFPTENDGSDDDAAHLAAAWQRADRLRLGWGLARVFGPYTTVRDADKAARHPQLWAMKDDHSDYVHTGGVLPQPGSASPQDTP